MAESYYSHKHIKPKVEEIPRFDPRAEESESSIWQRFKQGEEDAFILIYQSNFGKLYNFGIQFGFDADTVKDQIQELFIYIRNSRLRLADVRSVRFYLMKSLRRRLLRSKKSKFNLVSLFLPESQKLHEIEITDTPEILLINNALDSEIREKLSRSLNKLTNRQKEAVLHFYYEGFSYQEIAEMMELKMVKSARKLLYRAIEVMRKDLKGQKGKLFYFF
jgi:RNA polymerase sigma factor (sigma-70 family)